MQVVPKDKNGKSRHVKTLDEKLVSWKSEGIHPGNVVGIVEGEHAGMKALVVSVVSDTEISVKFKSDEEVVVDKKMLVLLSDENKKKMKKMKKMMMMMMIIMRIMRRRKEKERM